MDETLIKKALLEGSYISAKDIEAAEAHTAEHEGSFLDYLISKELTSWSIIGQALAESYGVPYSNLKEYAPSKDLLELLPEDAAKELRAVVFSSSPDAVVIATDAPERAELQEKLSPLFPDKTVSISFSLPEDIDTVLLNYEQALQTRFAQILEKGGRVAPEIVDQIVEDALLLRASDIHFEPREADAVVRFRIDGVLHEAGSVPKINYETILNRIKIQAKLRIDEHFSSQDGAIRYSSSQHRQPVDLRVSIVPAIDGEKIAIRILSSYVRDLTLSDIGLSAKLQAQILASAKKPFGMILVTGPTGSGKTTTLYSLIKLVNSKQVNITTIEDPVEYKIQGVNQIQVNVQSGLTFAKGLRAIARQDPNVILVGEIRDLETADIAVNAALTGHLLLSTFHANNAATAIPRFIDMGIEPFLLGSTLELVIAQRLVRRICNVCKVSYTMSKADLQKLAPEVRGYLGEKEITLYHGKGCNTCSGTGFDGRIGVFEFITVSSDLQDLIAKSPSTKDVATLAKSQGLSSMFEDGIEKVTAGTTTLEELLRVVAP